MPLINEHFLKLSDNYLFADIAKKVNAYKVTHPKERVISLGIGDVTQPLCPAVIEAMHRAVDEMGCHDTFHGYGPEQGYDFLREAIVRNDFLQRGIHLDPGEIFINDGAKSVTYLSCNAANGFIPQIPKHRVDIIYLCYPNNPTGMVLTKEELRRWVNYAIHNDTLILFDAAYERYIQDPAIPHSIYEIRGARKVAIEFRSYSKTAGFTGVRCGYTVIPKELTVTNVNGERVALNPLWNRRQCTKFNGASYISQRAAAAIYTSEGAEQVQAVIDYYMGNAHLMLDKLKSTGLRVYGGENAPYLWVKMPGDTPSWRFFEQLLYSASVVCTPGVGFGPSGEGYVRLTAFGNRADCEEAVERMMNVEF